MTSLHDLEESTQAYLEQCADMLDTIFGFVARLGYMTPDDLLELAEAYDQEGDEITNNYEGHSLGYLRALAHVLEDKLENEG